jgi:hypothetical protein
LQFLEPEDLGSSYQAAQLNARRNWLKYDEYERLANNDVRTDLPSNMPKVNDGSLAATLRKVPKRIMAQPMSGKIKATDRDEDWVAKLATIILEEIIVPNANTDAPFLSKWQTALKNALIYGAQPIYTFFTQHGTYTGADMSVPYVKNVYLEPGKISDLASDFIFMDSYYTKLQAKRLVEKAQEDAKSVEKGDLKEEDTVWDAVKLKAWLDAGPAGKDAQSMNRKERVGENRDEKGLFKLVTCFNRGYEAPFYTFAPSISDAVVGEQKNTNPTGDIPIIYLYADEDLINPYGTGLVQMAGATQNVLDNLTQTDVLATQIGNQPPIDIAGDRSTTNLKSMVYSPNAFWFTGNAKVTPVQAVNPNMYNAMPGRFSLYRSQLQFQTGTMDNTIPAEDGATGMSKTTAGVHANQANMDADDNFILQRVGDAYGRAIKSMINIHMNNMEGTELIKLEGSQIELMATTELVPTDENGEPMVNAIEVVWDNVRGSFDFNVDPMSSLKINDAEQAANLHEAISSITPAVSYYMSQDGYRFNLGEAYHSLLTTMKLENLDKIITKMTPEEKQEAQNAPFPIIDPPQLRYALADLPPEAVPAALANAGINFDASHMSMPWKDQAQMQKADAVTLSAQSDSLRAHAEVTGKQADLLNQVGAPADPTATGQPDPTQPQGYNPTAKPGQATSTTGQPQPPQTLPDMQQGSQPAAQTPQAAQAATGAPAGLTPQNYSPYASEMIHTPMPPSQPPMHPNPEQRILEIKEEYRVDEKTALGIMAAEDHGVDPMQYLEFIGHTSGAAV